MPALVPSSPPRLAGVDLARGMAVMLMFVAHVAPSDGPMRILLTSEFLTAPLFALLVGAGVQLAWSRRVSTPAFVLKEALHAVLLLGLGWLLGLVPVQIVIVLGHLGVLTLLATAVAPLPTPALAATTAGVGAVALVLPRFAGQPLLDLVGATGPYRLAAFALDAGVAMLVTRALTSRGRAPRRGVVAAAALLSLGLMGALLIATNLTGLLEVHAYDGTPAETLGDLAGALGILLACWLVPRAWALPLALVGRMTLSLYCLQVAILWVHGRVHPGERDDSWGMLALLVAASLALAWGWSRLPAWAGRGPVEALVARMERTLARGVTSRQTATRQR